MGVAPGAGPLSESEVIERHRRVAVATACHGPRRHRAGWIQLKVHVDRLHAERNIPGRHERRTLQTSAAVV
jgi:hypothetical protein